MSNGKKWYAEQLRDPRWQKRRLEILQQSDFKCFWCGDDKTELHVHHFFYEKGRMPWEYEDADLTALCKHCHEFNHLKGVPEPIVDSVIVLSLDPKKHGDAIRIIVGYTLAHYKK